jgi:uncharacterized protein DUF4232
VARHRLGAVTALVLVALAGCGAGDDAAGESPTPPPVTTTSSMSPSPTGGETAPPTQDNRCTADLLTGSVNPRDAAAGSRYATLTVTNKSNQVCTLWGFGGLELLDVAKAAVPTLAERDLDPAPNLVTLRPGASAAKNLRWGVIATGDEPTDGPCQPPAAGVRVLPPDETEPFEVDFDFGSVCAGGRIQTSAYYPG